MYKYYLLKLVTNTQGQDADPVCTIYKDADAKKALEKTVTAWHQQCAPLHNADDVLYAVVEVIDEYGRPVNDYVDRIDHRPTPEPET